MAIKALDKIYLDTQAGDITGSEADHNIGTFRKSNGQAGYISSDKIVQFENKKITPVVQTTGFRYSFSGSAPGYTNVVIAAAGLYEDIPVIEGSIYQFNNFTQGSGSISFFVDANGDRIKDINSTNQVAAGQHLAPRDAVALKISTSSIGSNTNFSIENIVPAIKGISDQVKWPTGINIANGWVVGFGIDGDQGVKPLALNSAILSEFIKVEEGFDYLFVMSKSTTSFTKTLLYYDSTFTPIAGSNIEMEREGGAVGTKQVFSIPNHVNMAYIRFELASISTDVGYVNEADFKWSVMKVDHFREIFEQTSSIYNFNAQENEKITLKTRDKLITDKRVLVMGDSISATAYGPNSFLFSDQKTNAVNGWIGYFAQQFRPKHVYNYAVGGATVSETSGEFGNDLIALGDNSLCKQAEQFISDYASDSVEVPDIIFIVGGTNDFGATSPNRFVTTAELGSTDYDEYMEETFMMPEQASYDNNIISELNTIPYNKVAGGIRYIVERLLITFPTTKFFICTPIQSTAHNMFQQLKTVRDIRWMANRLSIPLIDQWGAAQMPMLFDYKRDAGATDQHKLLGDNVHPFDNTGIEFAGMKISGKFISNEFYNKYFDF